VRKAKPLPYDPDITIVPGQPPPWLVPSCASCASVPVERFTVYPPTTEHQLYVEAECHGHTQGIILTPDDLKALKYAGKRIVMFRRRQGFDSVR
jgi:hypothetical protein